MTDTKHTPEIYAQAAKFYDSSPTGQYDDEAAHALHSHYDLLEALDDLIFDYESLQALEGHKQSSITRSTKAARAAIAKAKGDA